MPQPSDSSLAEELYGQLKASEASEVPMQEETPPSPEVQSGTTLTRRELYGWPVHDKKTKGSGAIPDWQFSGWSTQDIVKQYGL